jgi:hypothetical protein
VLDVILLTPLGSSPEQDHQFIALSAEIDAVSRSEIDPVFQHAVSNTFDIGKIALLYTDKSNCDLDSGRCVEVLELGRKRASLAKVDVFDDPHIIYGNVCATSALAYFVP